MKQTMTTNEVAAALRADDNANWSYAGALALAEYLEEWEREGAAEMEFDRVAIRCDFAEWESLQAWAVDYFGGEKQAREEFGEEHMPTAEDLETAGEIPEDKIRDYIQESGTLLEFNGGIIVSSF
jgi:hypothetical protein